jgi:hypothetical protein
MPTTSTYKRASTPFPVSTILAVPLPFTSLGGEAEFDKGRSYRSLLKITIRAEVNGVRSDYEMAFGRHERDNAAVGFAVARADVPGGREADAERLAAVIETLTGEEPKVLHTKNGRIMRIYTTGSTWDLARFAELADAIERWLEEMGHRLIAPYFK